MGFLDDMIGKAKGVTGAGGGEHSALLDGVLGMLAGGAQSGGLAGLIQSFQAKGLGDIISSWVGTGQNLPVSAEQMKSGLGDDALSGLAAKVGTSPESISSQLTQLLPTLIDKLTPDGKVPDAGMLQQGLNLLRGGPPKF